MLHSFLSKSGILSTSSVRLSFGPKNIIAKPLASGLSIRHFTAYNEEPKEMFDKLHKQIDVEVRGHDPAVLKSYSQFVSMAANELSIEMGKSWAPKKPQHDRLTLLRSIHVNKKCRVQYETRTYFRFMQFFRLTGSTSDTFLEYIQRNLPEGVFMKVTKISLEKVPDYLKPPEEVKGNIESLQ